jgi:hypothetical protein
MSCVLYTFFTMDIYFEHANMLMYMPTSIKKLSPKG